MGKNTSKNKRVYSRFEQYYYDASEHGIRPNSRFKIKPNIPHNPIVIVIKLRLYRRLIYMFKVLFTWARVKYQAKYPHMLNNEYSMYNDTIDALDITLFYLDKLIAVYNNHIKYPNKYLIYHGKT